MDQSESRIRTSPLRLFYSSKVPKKPGLILMYRWSTFNFKVSMHADYVCVYIAYCFPMLARTLPYHNDQCTVLMLCVILAFIPNLKNRKNSKDLPNWSVCTCILNKDIWSSQRYTNYIHISPACNKCCVHKGTPFSLCKKKKKKSTPSDPKIGRTDPTGWRSLPAGPDRKKVNNYCY